MRAALNYLVATVILGAIAGVVLTGSRVDRRVARAQQEVATLNMDDPEATYADLSGYLEFAESMPWLFGETRANIQTRRAAIRYWQGDYTGLMADYGDVNRVDVQNNLAVQFIVASAAYRAGMDPDTDRERVLRALDGAIDAYLGVLQESPEHLDAAYNYEHLIRLRADIAAGVEIPSGLPGLHGREGESPEEMEMDDIKIYVPVQREVDPEMDEDPTIGAGGRIRKKG